MTKRTLLLIGLLILGVIAGAAWMIWWFRPT